MKQEERSSSVPSHVVVPTAAVESTESATTSTTVTTSNTFTLPDGVKVGDSLKLLGVDASGTPQFQIVPAAATRHQNTSAMVFGVGFLFCPVWFMSFCLIGKKHLDSATSRCFNKVSMGCAIFYTILFIVWIIVLFAVLLPLWLDYVDSWYDFSDEYDGDFSDEYDGFTPNNTCCALGHYSTTLDADCTVDLCMPCPGRDEDCEGLFKGDDEEFEEALDACRKTCEIDCETHDDCRDGFCVLGIEDSDEGFCTACPASNSCGNETNATTPASDHSAMLTLCLEHCM